MNNPLSSSPTQSLRDEAAQLVTQEEFESIIAKMQGFMERPVGHLAKEDELYLEQQLSELLGFELLAELENVRLPHTLGVVDALPHLRRHPADTLAEHGCVTEAQLAPIRSTFGWFSELGNVSVEMQQREQFWISFPLEMLPDWPTNATNLREWLKWHKVCVINPVTRRAVVAVIANTLPSISMTAQFGGSPELIRYLQPWTTKTAGKVMVFLINDPQNQVPLGLQDLKYDYR